MRLFASLPLLALAACGGAVEPNANADLALAGLVLGDQQVFELTALDGKSADPAVVFDHRCAGARMVHTIRDSIVPRSDGTAERRFQQDRLADSRLLEHFAQRAVGTWTRLSPTSSQYVGNGPSIVVSLTTESVRVNRYDLTMRVRADRTLTTRGPAGGSCPGSPNDGRDVEYVYSAR